MPPIPDSPSAGPSDGSSDGPIDTPRLRLRRPERRDLPALAEILAACPSESKLPKTHEKTPSPGSAEAWLDAQAAQLAAGRPALRVVELRAGAGVDAPRLIGLAGLFRAAGARAEPELQILILPVARRAGLGTEAAAAALLHGFAASTSPRVVLRADPGDQALIRTAERIGMSYLRLSFDRAPRGEQVYALDRP